MTYLETFNLAGSAAVRGSRHDLARSLRAARRLDPDATSRVRYHASFVGWPDRVRPNGRYR